MALQNNLIVSSPWELREDHFEPEQLVTTGSNFMVGNGYLGYRGTFPDDTADQYVACVVTDTYDNADGVWEELVTAPNPLFTEIAVAGRPVRWREVIAGGTGSAGAPAAGDYRRTINLRSGEWSAGFSLPELGIVVESERFGGFDELHGLASRTRIRRTKGSGTITVRAGIDATVWNLNGTHLVGLSAESVRNGIDSTDDLLVTGRTVRKGVAVLSRVRHAVSRIRATKSRTETEGSSIFHVFEFDPAPGEEIVLDSFAAVYSDNDVRHERDRGAVYRAGALPAGHARPAPADAEIGAATVVAALAGAGYETARANHRDAWGRLWQDLDIELSGDPDAQVVLRFNMYQSVIATPLHTDHLPIGARGLSCQAYQGAAFWDQEIFNLPMFLYTRPEVARNILTYRARTLPGARAKAQALGFRGAFYAWVSGDTGEEICPSYFFKDVLSGRKIRNHFNDWQIHISPDIVYTIWKYVTVTGDDSFLYERGAEVVFEVARFLFSRAHLRVEAGTYDIIRVLGPDEYHENVDNNFFTNYQARFALRYAVTVLRQMETEAPQQLHRILSEIGLTDQEPARWTDLADRIAIAEPTASGSTGSASSGHPDVIEQFHGFFELEDATPEVLRSRLIDQGEYWGWPNGVAVETQVSKQADVLQLLALHPDAYPLSTIRANWEYYEPRTQHGSSLSPAVYALTAAWVGHMEEAERYFWKSCTVDLYNTNRAVSGGTFIGGIHTAACGVAWQIVVVGFAGMHLIENGFGFRPHLPPSWDGIRFTLQRHGNRVAVRLNRHELEIQGSSANSAAVAIDVLGEVRKISPGAREHFTLTSPDPGTP